MEESKQQEVIRHLIANQTDNISVDKIEPHHKLAEDLGIDSLDLVVIAIDCEKEFFIILDDTDMYQVDTVKGLYDIVAAKTSA